MWWATPASKHTPCNHKPIPMAATAPNDPFYCEFRAEAETDEEAVAMGLCGPSSCVSVEDSPHWLQQNTVVPGLLSTGGLNSGLHAAEGGHFTSVARIMGGPPGDALVQVYAENHLRWVHVPLQDTFGQPVFDHFHDVVKLYVDTHSTGGHLLIHCGSGVSRAPTFTIAVLMAVGPYLLSADQLNGRDPASLRAMDNAYQFMRRRRPVTNPNIDFMGHLLTVERALRGTATLAEALDALRPANLKAVAKVAHAQMASR